MITGGEAAINAAGEVLCCLSCRKTFQLDTTRPIMKLHSQSRPRHRRVQGRGPLHDTHGSSGARTDVDPTLLHEHFAYSAGLVTATVRSETSLDPAELAPITPKKSDTPEKREASVASEGADVPRQITTPSILGTQEECRATGSARPSPSPAPNDDANGTAEFPHDPNGEARQANSVPNTPGSALVEMHNNVPEVSDLDSPQIGGDLDDEAKRKKSTDNSSDNKTKDESTDDVVESEPGLVSPRLPSAASSPAMPPSGIHSQSWRAGQIRGAKMHREGAANLIHELMTEASTTADVDLPMCGRCWRAWLEREENNVATLRDDVAVLERLNSQLSADAMAMATVPPTDELVEAHLAATDSDQATKEVCESLQKEQSALNNLEAELAALDAENAELELEMQALKGDEMVLEREEDAVAEQLNDVLASQYLDSDSTSMLETKMLAITQNLQQLESVCGLDMLYPMTTDGAVASICGLRLGKLSNVQVPAAEVNAACFYALSLLSHLSRKHRVDTRPFELRPIGCEGHIEEVKGNKRNKLDFFMKTSFFSWKTFGSGWVAFAQVLSWTAKAIGEALAAEASNAAEGAAAAATKNITPPYKAEGEKLGDASVNFGSVSDETWTRGVKYAFTMLKWCIDRDAELAVVRKQRPNPLAPSLQVS